MVNGVLAARSSPGWGEIIIEDTMFEVDGISPMTSRILC